jgi:acid phosphatase
MMNAITWTRIEPANCGNRVTIARHARHGDVTKLRHDGRARLSWHPTVTSMKKIPSGVLASIAAASLLALASCHKHDEQDCSGDCMTSALQSKVSTVVVIFAENRSFDNLYGLFPGANGIPGVNATGTGTISAQLDRNAAGATLAKLPQTWGGVTAAGQTPVVTQAQSDNLANQPFRIDSTFGIGTNVVTRDLYHRFFENQMQINGGKNDKFAGYADSGGLVMGYYDGSSMAMWNVAKQNVLADNFFMGAFGGSFLTHQYLICACAPEFPNADTAASHPTIAVVDSDSSGKLTSHLTLAASAPASALDGPPTYVLSGNIAPKNYFGDGAFRAINTMQPPYQPSGNAPAASDATGLFSNPAAGTTLPAQTQATIGDRLTAKGVNWKWYAGAWANASANRSVIYNNTVPNFQAHHQPFNYFAIMDPVANATARAAHLKDYTDLVSDAAAGTLPPVVFYKPEGDLNQHAGYAAVAAGDAHLADVIAKLQASPQYPKMVIVVTYDENGGFWDHVAPPKGDLLGPSMRIPAIIVSPLAKRGTVDHTQYDTASTLRLITRLFGLDPLPGVVARDAALTANGGVPMGDLTNALTLR